MDNNEIKKIRNAIGEVDELNKALGVAIGALAVKYGPKLLAGAKKAWKGVKWAAGKKGKRALRRKLVQNPVTGKLIARKRRFKRRHPRAYRIGSGIVDYAALHAGFNVAGKVGRKIKGRREREQVYRQLGRRNR